MLMIIAPVKEPAGVKRLVSGRMEKYLLSLSSSCGRTKVVGAGDAVNNHDVAAPPVVGLVFVCARLAFRDCLLAVRARLRLRRARFSLLVMQPRSSHPRG